MQRSKKGIFSKLWKRISATADKSLVPNMADIISRMADPSNTAFVNKNYYLWEFIETYKNECNVAVIPEILLKRLAGVSLPKSSPYFDRFNTL